MLHREDLQRLPWRLRYETGPALASRCRRQLLLATHRHLAVEVAESAYLGPRFQVMITGGSLQLQAGVECRRDFYCEVSGGSVVLEEGVIFTSAAMIQCSTSVVVQKRAVLGQSVLIADGAHRFRDPDRHFLEQGYDFREVVIGEGAAIHSKVTITASIGKHAVIAANSLVTKPIPDYCLAGGVPARILEYFGPEEGRPPEAPAGGPATS